MNNNQQNQLQEILWQYKSKIIEKDTIKFKIQDNEKVISYHEWINLTLNNTEFIKYFIKLLIDCEFDAYYWEVKPVDAKSVENSFEFVLVNGSYLNSLNSDGSRFEKYFNRNEDVVSFKNLKGDAQLVVPNKVSDSRNYTHLAKFVRNAPENQIIKFWKKVAKEYSKSINEEKIWLSTAGLGVNWLHVRLDTKPKYYKYKEYKQ